MTCANDEVVMSGGLCYQSMDEEPWNRRRNSRGIFCWHLKSFRAADSETEGKQLGQFLFISYSFQSHILSCRCEFILLTSMLSRTCFGIGYLSNYSPVLKSVARIEIYFLSNSETAMIKNNRFWTNHFIDMYCQMLRAINKPKSFSLLPFEIWHSNILCSFQLIVGPMQLIMRHNDYSHHGQTMIQLIFIFSSHQNYSYFIANVTIPQFIDWILFNYRFILLFFSSALQPSRVFIIAMSQFRN